MLRCFLGLACLLLMSFGTKYAFSARQAGAFGDGSKNFKAAAWTAATRRSNMPAAARRLLDDGAIKKCLWSDSTGCALNPSFMFTVTETPDSYEQ